MKKAVGYCRYSSSNQREESIEAQIRAIEQYCKTKGIEEEIQKNQNKDTLFIVGLSSHILHDEPLPEWHNGGHVVIVSEINDEEVIIHDPWVPTLRYYPVPKKRFLAAVQDSWEYNFIQVHYYNGNSEI